MKGLPLLLFYLIKLCYWFTKFILRSYEVAQICQTIYDFKKFVPLHCIPFLKDKVGGFVLKLLLLCAYHLHFPDIAKCYNNNTSLENVKEVKNCFLFMDHWHNLCMRCNQGYKLNWWNIIEKLWTLNIYNTQ